MEISPAWSVIAAWHGRGDRDGRALVPREIGLGDRPAQRSAHNRPRGSTRWSPGTSKELSDLRVRRARADRFEAKYGGNPVVDSTYATTPPRREALENFSFPNLRTSFPGQILVDRVYTLRRANFLFPSYSTRILRPTFNTASLSRRPLAEPSSTAVRRSWVRTSGDSAAG